jgi:predicted phosphodiesterase
MNEKIFTADLSEGFDFIELYPIADVHVGDPTFREKEFLRFIDYIRNTPNAFAICIGDLINNAVKSSVSNVYEETMPPKEQKKKIIEYLQPIKDKILALTGGNHEYRSSKDVDNDITQDIAMILGIGERYSQDDIKLKISLGKKKTNGKKATYNIFATHGYSGGRRIGNTINNMELSGLNYENVDIYIFGHAHKKAVYKSTVFIFDDKNNCMLEKERYFVLVSSWIGYNSHAKRKVFIPSAMGTAKIMLSGKEKRINVEV